MGKRKAKNETATPSPAQTDAIVTAAAQLEEACRDLTGCLRALPGLVERRAAALLLRTAAVAGRLLLKDAIRVLDQAWVDDKDGPLCGEPRVVPETPEKGSPAGGSDGEEQLENGVAASSDDEEDRGLSNGVANGSLGEDKQSEAASVHAAAPVKSKRKKKSSSDSDDSAKSPVKTRPKRKKKRAADSEDENELSANDEKSSPVKVEPLEESDPGLVISNAEPICELADSEEVIVKTEPEVPEDSEFADGMDSPMTTVHGLSAVEDAERDGSSVGDAPSPGGDPPAGDDSSSSEEESPDTNPEGQNERDRLALLASSGDEDADDPGPGGDVPDLGDPGDSDSTAARSGNDAGGGSASSASNSESRNVRKLRKRAVKEEPANSGSDSAGRDARKKRRSRRGEAKKPADSDSKAGRRTRKSRARRQRGGSGSDSASDDAATRGRRRHDKPKRSVSKSSVDSGSDSGAARRSERRGRRRRRPRGPAEPTADCNVVLTRLPPEIENEATENGFVKITKRAKKQLSEETVQVRRLANVAALLRTSIMKADDSSDDTDDDDSEMETKKKARKTAGKGTLKSDKKKKKTLKDMSDGESGGRPSGDESDDPSKPSTSGLVPIEENAFDREQLLASDSGSEADIEAAQDDDSDFALSDKDNKRDKDNKKGKLKKEAKESDEERNSSEDDETGKDKTKKKKKTDSNEEERSSDEKNKDKKPKQTDDPNEEGRSSDEENSKDKKAKKTDKVKVKSEDLEEDEDESEENEEKGETNKKKKRGSDEENSKDKKAKKTDKGKIKSEDLEEDEDKSEDSEEKGETNKKKKKKKEGDEDASETDDKHEDKVDGDANSESNASGSESKESKGKKKQSKQLSSKVRKLLNGKMSATDSSEEDEIMKEKMLSKRAKQAEAAEKAKADSDKSDADEDGNVSDDLPTLVNMPSSSEEEVVEKKRTPRKKRMRVVDDSDSDLCVLESDPAESEEDDETSKKRGRSSSSASISSASDSDSADDFKPPKKTRSRTRLKRIKRMSDDSASSSEDNSEDDEKPESQGTPGKSGRKNIRHIREAEQSTKEASQAELDRRKRIEDKQNMYNELFKKSGASDEPEVPNKLVLDFDPETKKELVSVHKNFVKILKPHQVDGVKFMFDSTIESVKRLEDESNHDNAGCILGHCMGLGKTLQVVVLLHTLLTSKATRGHISCALVVCPKNTVQNWVRELKNWQKKCRVQDVDVVNITFKKDNYERSFELEQWQTEGGVCVLSYDMFKRFGGTGGKKGYAKKVKDRFQKALMDPGPDMIVCDEGHLLKNPRTAAFKSLNLSKCRRRVILTGTPLQNNLREYHTMVEFVKPRLLGSESEFSNRFIRPIENGSAVDAMPRDVKLMKRRSHVLYKLLNSVVQRRDYNVLMPFLPPKLEFTLMVKLSDLQKKLYESYLEKARGKATRKVLADFQALSRVWTHPRSIQMKDEQDDAKEDMKSEREAMERFVADDETTTEEEDAKEDSPNGEENNPNGEQADDAEWWRSCIPDDMQFEDPNLSGKLMLLDQLLIKCENIGDKLLVFSQSLFSLNVIEEHLARLHKEMQKCRNSDKKHPSHVYFGTWKEDYDYYRLDGSTPEDRRQLMCDRINKASNERARLMLISTKAGGLGINLVGANRVVIFDASWNPTADSQAIFRVYRFGQVKPSYVYRFIAQGCMEEKIYDRQITKLSLSCRVVDEQQVERHFNQHDVEELYEFEPDRKRTTGLIVPKDDLVLMELVSEQSEWVSSVHGHDSLLQNVADEELNADEQRAAWEEYENDRRGIPNVGDIIPLIGGKAIDKATVIQMIKKDNPTATDNEVLLMIPKAIQTLRAYYFKKQQQEQRIQEERYRQTLELQRQHMYSQHAQQGGANTVDMSTYAQLLEMMAKQRTMGTAMGPPGAAPSHSRQQVASAPKPPPAAHASSSSTQGGRQRTAHQPGPAHVTSMQPAAATGGGMRALAEAAAASRKAVEARLAGGSGASVAGVSLPKHLTVQSVKDKKKDQDGGKGDKSTKPPDVVDIT